MSLDISSVYVGTTRRLDGYRDMRGGYPAGQVRVSYKDKDGVQRIETLCADGARLLGKALIHNANLIDPKGSKS